MQRSFFPVLLMATLLVSIQPAFADHHQGAGTHHHHHGQGMGHGGHHGHAQMNQTQMQDGKIYAERALDLMKAGNMMVDEGAKKKDAKMMIQGAKLLKTGMQMHHKSMHAMKDMMHGLKHKLMHAKVGDLQLSDKEMADLEAQMKALKETHASYAEVCHKEVALMPQSAHMLIQMADELITKGLKEKNADKLMLGSEMMELGMALLHPHGMKEEGHQWMRHVRQRMNGGLLEDVVEVTVHH